MLVLALLLTTPAWYAAGFGLARLVGIDPCNAVKSQPGGWLWFGSFMLAMVGFIALAWLLGNSFMALLAHRRGELTADEAWKVALYAEYPRPWLATTSEIVFPPGDCAVRISTNPAMPLTVRMRFVRLLGWIGVVEFLGFATLAFVSGSPALAFGFAPFIALSAYLVAYDGTLCVTAREITYACPLGSFAIAWNEIEFLETDAIGQMLVLSSNSKRLPIYGTSFWSGASKEELMAFMDAQLRERRIPVRTSQRALFRWPKNVRANASDRPR